MNLYLLSGNSRKNLPWVEEASKYFRDLFDECFIQRYEHWSSKSESSINLDLEAANLTKLTVRDSNYLIFAKSAGVVTTLKAVQELGLNPRACVFCGFPLSWIEERNVSAGVYVTNYSIPTTFVQNTLDPFCSAAKLRNLLRDVNCSNYRFIETPGTSHDYTDFKLLREALGSYLS